MIKKTLLLTIGTLGCLASFSMTSANGIYNKYPFMNRSVVSKQNITDKLYVFGGNIFEYDNNNHIIYLKDNSNNIIKKIPLNIDSDIFYFSTDYFFTKTTISSNTTNNNIFELEQSNNTKIQTGSSLIKNENVIYIQRINTTDGIEKQYKIKLPFNIEKILIKENSKFLIKNKDGLYYEIDTDFDNKTYIINKFDPTDDQERLVNNAKLLFNNIFYQLYFDYTNNKILFSDMFAGGNIEEKNPVDNISDIKYISIFNNFDRTQNNNTLTLLLNINNQDYIDFNKVSNDALPYFYDDIKYKQTNSGDIIEYTLKDEDNNEQAIDLNLDIIKDTKTCGNFDSLYIKEPLLYIKYDNCLYNATLKTTTSEVFYKALNLFMKDYYNKINTIQNFNEDDIKDTKTVDILKINQFFKYKALLNSISDANKYMNALSKMYVIAYYKSLGFNLEQKIEEYKDFTSYINNIYDNLVSDKNKISTLQKNIDTLNTYINTTLKIKMMEDRLLLEKFFSTNDLRNNITIKLDDNNFLNTDFYNVSTTGQVSSFNNTIQDVFTKKAEYTKNILNNTYKKHLIENANNFYKINSIYKTLKTLSANNKDLYLIDSKNQTLNGTGLIDLYTGNVNELLSQTVGTIKIKEGSGTTITGFKLDNNIPFFYNKKDVNLDLEKEPQYKDVNLVGSGLKQYIDLSISFEYNNKVILNKLNNSDTIIQELTYSGTTVNNVKIKDLVNNFNNYFTGDINNIDVFADIYENHDNELSDNDKYWLNKLYIKNKVLSKTDMDNYKNYKISDLEISLTDELKNNNLYDTGLTLTGNIEKYYDDIINNDELFNSSMLYVFNNVLLKTYNEQKTELIKDINLDNFKKDQIDLLLKGNNITYQDPYNDKEVIITKLSELDNISLFDANNYKLIEDKYYVVDNYNNDFFDTYIQIKQNDIDKEPTLKELDERKQQLSDLKNKELIFNNTFNNNLEFLNSINNTDIKTDYTIYDILNTIDIKGIVDIIRNKKLADEKTVFNNFISTKQTTKQDNLTNLGNYLKFIQDDFSDFDGNKLGNLLDEKTKLSISDDIVKKINTDNIDDYASYSVKKPEYLNEYYSSLLKRLLVKQKILIGQNAYTGVIAQINDLYDNYKNSADEIKLNNYKDYLLNTVDRLYGYSIYDKTDKNRGIYNILDNTIYGGQKKYNFIMKDFLDNIQKHLNNVSVTDRTNIFYNSDIEFVDGKYTNKLYDKLTQLINDNYDEILKQVKENIDKQTLNNIQSNIDKNSSTFDNDIKYLKLESFYNDNFDAINTIIDKGNDNLKELANNTLQNLNSFYDNKNKVIEQNISNYINKILKLKINALYAVNNIDDLNNAYTEIKTDIYKALHDTSKTSTFDNCIISDKQGISKEGFKVEDDICGNIDINYASALLDNAKTIYSNVYQTLNNRFNAKYFLPLIASEKKGNDVLNNIFDWNGTILKENNKDIQIIQPASKVTRINDCSYIIYKNAYFLGLKCTKSHDMLEKIDSLDDPIVTTKLYFSTLNGSISKYNILEQKTSTYESVFLKKQYQDTYYYLKAYYIPNETNNIYIANSDNIYANYKFDKPFYTSVNSNDIVSKINYDINHIDYIVPNTFLFDDQDLDFYIKNNITNIIENIDIIKDKISGDSLDNLYNNFIKKINSFIKDDNNKINTKDDLLKMNSDKETLLNVLNLINNINYQNYEENSSSIKNMLNDIKYFSDAKRILLNQLEKKVKIYEEFKNNAIFQQKVSEMGKKLDAYTTFIDDTSFTGLDKHYNSAKDFIKNNFFDKKILENFTEKNDSKYNYIKSIIQKNIERQNGFVDFTNKEQKKIKVYNDVTKDFNTQFVEQITLNKIIIDNGLLTQNNGKYVVDKTKLDDIKGKTEKKIDNIADVNIKNLKDNNTSKYALANNVLDGNLKDNLVYFDYMVLQNGKYTIPTDVSHNKITSEGNFFDGTNSASNHNNLKILGFETIKSYIKDNTGKTIGNTDMFNNISLFLNDKDTKYDLPDNNFNDKTLVVIKNLGDGNNNLFFYKVDTNNNKTPIYLDDYKINNNMAKYIKNYTNNIQGIKTNTLIITR